MEQKLHKNSQLMWLTKLISFDYVIEYKKGITNKVSDALSRVSGAELFALVLSTTSSDLMQAITHSWDVDPNLKTIIEQLQANPTTHPHFTWYNNLMRRKRKLVVGKDQQLRKDIIALWHSTPQGYHSGIEATLKRVMTLFYWKEIRDDVKIFVPKCNACQRSKADLAAYRGL